MAGDPDGWWNTDGSGFADFVLDDRADGEDWVIVSWPGGAPNPWPRGNVDRAEPGRWYVASKTTPGIFYRTEWSTTPATGHFWTCTCPAGVSRGRMGGAGPTDALERPCRHVRAVAVAEADDGYPARPTGSPNVAGLVD